MNILFFTLVDFNTISERSIYTDLLREFVKHGHHVYSISPTERRKHIRTTLIQEPGSTILKLKIGNIQKTNIFEKGLSTIAIEPQFIYAIKKYFYSVKFDLVLYSTPPITFSKAVKYIKKRDGAVTYLMLKDIFPQNAVDLGMMKKSGIGKIIYSLFRKKEEQLYEQSDRIGCMSKANVQYILNHNPKVRKRHIIAKKKYGKGMVEVCPNSIEPIDLKINDDERNALRKKYKLPEDRVVFVYGGNLGKPQGIDFLLKCLYSQRKNEKVFFLIVGEGTEFYKIDRYIKKYRPENIRLYNWIPKEEFERLIASCDVGIISLDYRFTIPNFPSRLLSYLQAKLPVLAITDPNTDIGKVVEENGFGWWCKKNSVGEFEEMMTEILKKDGKAMGMKGYLYLRECYDVGVVCEKILGK